ncbi:DUF1439 domain-containing protein [Rheinheimera sp. 4Y26]|uniref:DUF1439 domain-containing protein n=1 Tax=Rheinheimera sp. 4Y26 TaxID=2977811 RepID=UPI0021B0F8D0|nr:DUF1439 domain-containing protein [Rheinheimera sp. 4Y26]MCT6700438.1 DUF1439 domain-containing protein [Rheinheimera sp. 4Y26]
MLALQRYCWLFCLVLLLTSCSQTNQLALYRLSQAELNQQLSQQLQQLAQKATVAGLPLKLQVKQLDVQIAPQGKPDVQLTLDTAALVQLAVVQLPVQLKLSLSAEPYFDQQRQAVYLRRFQLLNSEMAAGGMQGKLKPLSADVARLLQQQLTQMPLYRLDPNKLSHRMLLNIPLQLQLTPGQISLSPAYQQGG